MYSRVPAVWKVSTSNKMQIPHAKLQAFQHPTYSLHIINIPITNTKARQSWRLYRHPRRARFLTKLNEELGSLQVSGERHFSIKLGMQPSVGGALFRGCLQ
jgi:hypothetical protein